MRTAKRKPSLHPSWEQVAELQREVQRLKGKCNVLAREAVEVDNLSFQCDHLRDRCNVLVRKSNEQGARAHELDERLAKERNQWQAKLLKLEYDLGRSESLVARLQGRVIVLAREDIVAEVVKALVDIRNAALQAAPYEEGNGLLGDGGRADNHPALRRLRWVRDECKRVMELYGVQEKEAADVEKEKGYSPH